MEEQGIDFALGENPEEGPPRFAELAYQRQMLLSRRVAQRHRIVGVEPSIADRDVLPSHRFEDRLERAPEMRHLDPALERHQRAQMERAERAFGRQVGKVRRSVNHLAPHAPVVAGRMAAQVAEISAADLAQQVEVHDHAARCASPRIRI